jgi:hypothetical protein
MAEKFRSFSEPGQKISAEPTALTASIESAPESVFLPADNTHPPHRPSRESPAARSPTMARPRKQKDRAEPAEFIPLPVPLPNQLPTPLPTSLTSRSLPPGPFLPAVREPRPLRFLLLSRRPARSFPL